MLVLFVGTSFGCASRKAPTITPLSARDREVFFSRAQDERRFWLTRYESDFGPVFTGGNRVHADRFARVEFQGRRDSTVPALVVRMRGAQEYTALLDTSARANWVEFGLSEREGIIPIGPPPHRLFPAHVRDAVPGYLSVVSRLVINGLHVDTALVYVKAAHGPLDILKRDLKMDVPLILGGDFIRAFHFVQIDFPNRTILFSTTNPYKPDAERLIAQVPLRDYFGIFVLEGYIDGMETLFALDSLGEFALASNLDLPSHARQVMIGDLVLRNVAHTDVETLALGIPDLPRIGGHVLNRFIVTFDTRQRIAYFERP